MSSHLRFDDEDGEYESSESEEEYTEREKQLLNKAHNRKKEYSDNEDEVYGVGPSEDEDDDEEDNINDIASSDIEGQDEDDDLPNIKAWGKDRRKYYSTDYVDPDYGGFQGKDAQLAELEEQEAMILQKQLAEQMDDEDFSLDIFVKKSEEDKKQVEEIIKTDISKLTKREKLQILHNESPELFGLIDDFKAKMLIAADYLCPLLEKYKKGDIPNSKAIEFVQTQYELILNYSTNIYMYLLLKSSKAKIENHPIVKRLYQYRELLSQLDPVYETVVKPQIELLLEENDQTKDDQKAGKKRKLKLLATLMNKTDESKKKKKQVTIIEGEQPNKKIRVEQHIDSSNKKDLKGIAEPENTASDSSSEEDNENGIEQETEENGTDKRAITYKMAKNKGLTPYRKKELRNPRVKHRLKYRKAVIRRKGAVREPRKELTRYAGEISGIKASVSKSIKIKT